MFKNCKCQLRCNRSCPGTRNREKLILHPIKTAKEKGYRILQFNAVVKTNLPAISLYKALGFKELGTIPGAYESIRGEYEDILLFYYNLMDLK